MRRFPATVVLAVLVAACSGGGDSDPADAVATQAERVATLLEQGADCRALEAAATLQTLAEEVALDESAREAVALWTDQARQHLSCEAPASTEPQPEGGAPAPQGDGVEDANDDRDDGPPQDQDDEGEGRGDGPPEDRDDEGEGRGDGQPEDRANEGEGQGNGPPGGRGGGDED